MESLDLPTIRIFSTLSRVCREEVGPLLWRSVRYHYQRPKQSTKRDRDRDLIDLYNFCDFLISNPRKAAFILNLAIEIDLPFGWVNDASRIERVGTAITKVLQQTPNLNRLRFSIPGHHSLSTRPLNRQDFSFRLKFLDYVGDANLLDQFLPHQTNIRELTLYYMANYESMPHRSLPNLSRISGSFDQLRKLIPGRPITTVRFIETVSSYNVVGLVCTLLRSTTVILHLQIIAHRHFPSCLSLITLTHPRIRCLEVFLHSVTIGSLDDSEMVKFAHEISRALSNLICLEVLVWSGYQTPLWTQSFVKVMTGTMSCPALRAIVFLGDVGDHYVRQSTEESWVVATDADIRMRWGEYDTA